MKQALLIILLAVSYSMSYAQPKTEEKECCCGECAGNYKMYPTRESGIFLKLDTRTGQIWTVQYIWKKAGEMPFAQKPTVTDEDGRPGRFTLYPTENSGTFILLDKTSGKCYKVELHTNPAKSKITEIN